LRVIKLFSALPAFWALGAEAAQTGPSFPTHRFPTDTSYHLGYRLNRVISSGNFVDTRITEALTNRASVKVWQHRLDGEFQPTRQLSIGGSLALDTMGLGDNTGLSVGKTAISDQKIFVEYRFLDERGYSLGGALVTRFPGYTNPTPAELTSDNNGTLPQRAVFIGDAAAEFSALMTGELWPTSTLRIRGDFGYQHRLSGFSSELPFLLSAGFVTPKIDFDLRIYGNLTLNNSNLDSDPDLPVQSGLFAGSKYSLSKGPWMLALQPALETWITTSWGLTAEYTYSLVGNEAPSFHRFGVGFMYRWAQTKRSRPRTFQEVDIGTDQEEGRFQGEEQSGSNEPRATENTPIKEESTIEDEIFD
jgi:hypothetical protein